MKRTHQNLAILLCVLGPLLGQDSCEEDPCPDGDLDGICDRDDQCPGFDDALDDDGDGLPDSCETFVQVSGSNFTLGGQPFHYVGSNTYYLMTYAAEPSLRPYVDEILEEAALRGERVIRTWAFNDGDGWNALQRAPGDYDEAVFEGLDYVVWRAGELGLRLVLPIVNNWDDYGGMMQYVAWSESAQEHDDFYNDAQSRQFYQNHAYELVSRVNQFTGVSYGQDPTIFAWELANEARCLSDTSGQTLSNWVDDMAFYIQSIDENHLVTTGSEGFYDVQNSPWYLNGSQGYDFVQIHSSEWIDFSTAHNYPDHWGMNRNEALDLVEMQLSDSHNILDKPFVLGEFGKLLDEEVLPLAYSKHHGGAKWGEAYEGEVPGSSLSGSYAPSANLKGASPLLYDTDLRDAYFEDYFSTVYDQLGGGAMYWVASHDDYPNYDGFGVYDPADVNTIMIIEDYGVLMRSLAY